MLPKRKKKHQKKKWDGEDSVNVDDEEGTQERHRTEAKEMWKK